MIHPVLRFFIRFHSINMAQMYRRRDQLDESQDVQGSRGGFKFNVAAPEFVPTAASASAQISPPITGYFHPYLHCIDGSTGAWICVAVPDQDVAIQSPPPVLTKPNPKVVAAALQQQERQLPERVHVPEEIKNKIIKQAEYMFSDISMLANETLVKYVNKDQDGFVPMNFVTTLKKLKSLNVNGDMVAQALSSSTKLVLSNDGKKLRRAKPFTEKEKEELQLRTVIAENLPDDHSHQKIEKIFNSVGSIRSIRICQPQDPNSRSPKSEAVVSNKLHALVEYDSPESAEKAAKKLNDERNWRKGMRVRVMLKRSPKSVLKSHKSELDACFDNEVLEDANKAASASDTEKIWFRNRAKPKDKPQLQTSRSLPSNTTMHSTSLGLGQPAKGPRMPDGTRGFSMGRGKSLSACP